MAIWDAQGYTPPRLLRGHDYLVYGVGWSPDGRWLASSGWDNLIQVWDASTGAAGQRMSNPDDLYTNFYGLAWSPGRTAPGQWELPAGGAGVGGVHQLSQVGRQSAARLDPPGSVESGRDATG